MLHNEMDEYRAHFEKAQAKFEPDIASSNESGRRHRFTCAEWAGLLFCLTILGLWTTYVFCYPLIEPGYRSPLVNEKCDEWTARCKRAKPCMENAQRLCEGRVEPCYHRLVHKFCTPKVKNWWPCEHETYYCHDPKYLKQLETDWKAGGAQLSYWEELERIFSWKGSYRLRNHGTRTEFDSSSSMGLMSFTLILYAGILSLVYCTCFCI